MLMFGYETPITSANKVLIQSGGNKLNSQSQVQVAVAPATINLIEVMIYIDSAIGWQSAWPRLHFKHAAPAK
jgi:hypothetical protein